MPIAVQIHQSDETPLVNTEGIQELVRMIAIDHDANEGRISIAILSDPEIREINKQYLDHDYETDVISFNLSDSEESLDGEIVVSADTARRVSLEAGWTESDELRLYIIHGMLHILGYEDDEPNDRDEMRQCERHYLKELGIEGWERHPAFGEANPESMRANEES